MKLPELVLKERIKDLGATLFLEEEAEDLLLFKAFRLREQTDFYDLVAEFGKFSKDTNKKDTLFACYCAVLWVSYLVFGNQLAKERIASNLESGFVNPRHVLVGFATTLEHYLEPMDCVDDEVVNWAWDEVLSLVKEREAWEWFFLKLAHGRALLNGAKRVFKSVIDFGKLDYKSAVQIVEGCFVFWTERLSDLYEFFEIISTSKERKELLHCYITKMLSWKTILIDFYAANRLLKAWGLSEDEIDAFWDSVDKFSLDRAVKRKLLALRGKEISEIPKELLFAWELDELRRRGLHNDLEEVL